MLSDNIKKYRKKSNMSQDDLAEKLGVSRQSISLWETGQTQPTIDNIIALAKIFNISSDILLGTSDSINISQDKTPEDREPKGKRKKRLIITIVTAIAVVISVVILVVSLMSNHWKKAYADNVDTDNHPNVDTDNTPNVDTDNTPNADTDNTPNVDTDNTPNVDTDNTPNVDTDNTPNVDTDNTPNVDTDNTPNVDTDNTPNVDMDNHPDIDNETGTSGDVQFDLFTYCKYFAIKKGTLYGDYCIYQQPSTKYGGYENEYFSISYWSGSDMVEFCLHCPLSETYSINFYLRMRGGYDKKYEYLSSKYYRDTGESLRSVTGYIDPAVFFDGYPISWDKYEGSFDGQDEFMEESRVGICDLIRCLKEFVKVENMECDFSDFEFVYF